MHLVKASLLLWVIFLNSSLVIAQRPQYRICLLYTSDAADERSSVDLGGRRIIKKKTQVDNGRDILKKQKKKKKK